MPATKAVYGVASPAELDSLHRLLCAVSDALRGLPPAFVLRGRTLCLHGFLLGVAPAPSLLLLLGHLRLCAWEARVRRYAQALREDSALRCGDGACARDPGWASGAHSCPRPRPPSSFRCSTSWASRSCVWGRAPCLRARYSRVRETVVRAPTPGCDTDGADRFSRCSQIASLPDGDGCDRPDSLFETGAGAPGIRDKDE